MNINTILLAVDRDSSDGGVATAAALATRFNAQVTVAHVDRRPAAGQVIVAEVLDALERFGVIVRVRLERPTAGASIADSLLAMSDLLKPDMIVLGSRGRPAPLASLFGSVSREVARRAHVPVLIVRKSAGQPGPPSRLLLVVTEETLGSAELDVAIELAEGLGANVTVLHVHGWLEETVEDALKVPADRGVHQIVDLFLAKLRAAGIEASLIFTSNHNGLASEISRAAISADCDLIVIPAGMSDVSARWLRGTVEEEVARRSGSPVLVAHATPAG